MKLPNPYTQRKLAEARDLPPRNGPFAAINVGFHETYTRLVEQVLAQLGESVPVVVLIGDDATLLCDGGEQREQVIPARYHELKALAHLAFGVQLTLMANGSGRLTELTANELHEKRAQIREAQAAANSASSTPTVTIAPRRPPSCCAAHVHSSTAFSRKASWISSDFMNTSARLASHALETAQLAVCIELEQLHALLGRWRNDLGERRWAGLYVVICGAHQPRYREATCQYFGRLLHQPEGSGAEREDRLVYGEGLCDVDAALDLLARHIVDQRASNLLFGDRRRLQEDLLADAARHRSAETFPEGARLPKWRSPARDDEMLPASL